MEQSDLFKNSATAALEALETHNRHLPRLRGDMLSIDSQADLLQMLSTLSRQRTWDAKATALRVWLAKCVPILKIIEGRIAAHDNYKTAVSEILKPFDALFTWVHSPPTQDQLGQFCQKEKIDEKMESIRDELEKALLEAPTEAEITPHGKAGLRRVSGRIQQT